ncbi:hypothetical protein CBR_g52587 [Chara braunii]|uniref:Uncharacterized protein n=1 Tax=Chara braunii TaxID=69332 RepID=A0A388MAM7_CHABU|nr:hypothetical protein CBR_g52587 [Chara braunii]|eukprot:GBG91553.1 hypothetical protein CBR_g52587 [Chara braunii]
MAYRNGLHGFRPKYLQFLWRWERMAGDGPVVTAVLDYSHCNLEARLKINVEGAKDEEMRADQGLQAAITEGENRAKRRYRRDGITEEVKVTVSYLEAESSAGTTEREQETRDTEAESEASDLDVETQSWHGLDQWHRDHVLAEAVEDDPKASSRRA